MHGILAGRDLYRGLAIQAGMAYVQLPDVLPTPQALKTIPRRLIFEYRVLPLSIEGDSLLLAISDQADPEPLDQIERYTQGRCIRTTLAYPDDIDSAIDAYYGYEDLAA